MSYLSNIQREKSTYVFFFFTFNFRPYCLFVSLFEKLRE